MLVELYCIKINSKLRVRVSSDGYFKNTNCQFPRDLRMDGRKYIINSEAISLITTKGKFYYSVKNKNAIQIIDSNIIKKPERIFTDDSTEECIICIEKQKSIVFSPCGHFYSCDLCSFQLKQCPVCRNVIISKIKYTDFATD